MTISNVEAHLRMEINRSGPCALFMPMLIFFSFGAYITLVKNPNIFLDLRSDDRVKYY